MRKIPRCLSSRLAVILAALTLVSPAPSAGQGVSRAGQAGGAASPEARVLTDARSITSLPNPEARPVPIDNLYFTRNAFGAAWSPDGREVLFTSDIAGRFNLWKVPASGGWPVQLTQSDDVQSGAVWSRDGKWIVYQQDSGGNELYDLYVHPA